MRQSDHETALSGPEITVIFVKPNSHVQQFFELIENQGDHPFSK